ncbi:MAG: hypothetical protein J5855_05755, partial [Mailhella sp.]|nr:hypothetical protein [Mailhella sp.]
PSPVPDNLARQFEKLLEDPATSGQPKAEQSIRPPAESGTVRTESVQISEHSEIHVEKAGSSEAIGKAADGSPAGAGWLPSPTELYSLQFQVAMLRFTAESGSQVQRQASEGLNSLLRGQS